MLVIAVAGPLQKEMPNCLPLIRIRAAYLSVLPVSHLLGSGTAAVANDKLKQSDACVASSAVCLQRCLQLAVIPRIKMTE